MKHSTTQSLRITGLLAGLLLSALTGAQVSSPAVAPFAGGVGGGDDNALSQLFALPTELIAFGAEATTEGVTVRWVTGRTIAVDRFVVEESVDGRTFTDRAVRAALTTDTGSAYAADLRRPEATQVTYRLRVEEADGTHWYSELTHLAFTGSGWSLTPLANPVAGDRLAVRVGGLRPGESGMFEVSTFGGRVVHSAYFVATDDRRDLTVPHRLPPGTYAVVVVRQDGSRLTDKVVVR